MGEVATAAVSGPRILGRYAVYDAIASGGMATVHYGRLLGPVGFSRTVAIKRLHPQFAQDPEFVTMFLDEARLAARIRHPNVVATLDVVATANEIFLVMDYVHGESLTRVLREVALRAKTVPLPIALRIASDVLQGLHAAHEARDERGIPLNIVHRDVSPQNILLGVDGIARVVDFGVAKAAGRAQTTRDGQIKGKLGYMAPEQVRATKLTRQTDIHAMSTVLWEMLTGKRLFAGETEADTIAKVAKHEIPRVSEVVPGLPPEIDEVLRRGFDEDLDRRYATAREMCVALEGCGTMSPTMQVADWISSQAHDLLERRAEIVRSIERDEGSGSLAAPKDLGASSAKEWLAQAADSGVNTRSMLLDVAALPPAAERSISVIVDGLGPAKASTSRARWVGAIGLSVGVLGVIVAIIAVRGTSGRASPAPAASADLAPMASVHPETAASSPAQREPMDTVAPVAPLTATAATAPTESAAPPSPRPPTRPATKPARPRSTPAPTGNGVFDSRE